MAAKNWKNLNLIRRARREVLSTLGVQNLPQMALSLTVFEINNIFHFCQKFKKAAEIRKNQKFSDVPEE